MDMNISELAKKCNENDYINLRVHHAIKELDTFDILILRIIYQNAIEIKAVDENGDITNITSQAYLYSELADCIKEYISVKHRTIYISLNLLENLGLILQVSVGHPEYRYAISTLGIEVIKHI